MPLNRPFQRRARAALRVALSHYVLIGLSAAVGLFVISGAVHLVFGAFAAATAAIGVIVVVPPDQPAPRRGKFRQLLPSAVVGLPLFLAVQVLHDDPIRLGLLIVPASFFAFLGAAWGKRGIPVSISAMFAIIFSIAVPSHADVRSDIVTSLYFALGMASYVVYATLSNLALNERYRVLLVADTLFAIAALMRTEAGQFAPAAERMRAPVDPIGRLIRDQAALADQMQGARDILLESPRTARRQQLAGMLLGLLDMRDHLLACELDLERLVAHPGPAHALTAMRETLYALATEIERLADCLLTGRRARLFRSHRPRLATLQWPGGERADADGPSPAILARGIADRIGHIDDETLRLIALARGDADPDLAVVRAAWQMFVSPTTWSWRPFASLWRWDAPPLRHAIRAALAIATAYAIALALPWGTHPYWILLTITVVLRGSLAQTIERRNSRVVGTLLGSLVAGLLLWLEPPAIALLLAVTAAQGIAHAFAIRRYLITAVAATVLALVQAHLLAADVSPVFEAFERIADTVIGVAIAWAFSYVLPSWERTQIPVLVRRALQAHARHARLALGLGQLQAVDNQPELEWRLARREAYDSLSALVQATQRSLSEPRAVRPPLEPLGKLLAHSYQLLAQLTAAKTMLLLRRGRLDAIELVRPLKAAADAIGSALVDDDARPGAASSAADRRTPGAAARDPNAAEPLALPDPFQHDLSPWLLRRLRLATALAVDVRVDARQVLQATEPAFPPVAPPPAGAPPVATFGPRDAPATGAPPVPSPTGLATTASTGA